MTILAVSLALAAWAFVFMVVCGMCISGGRADEQMEKAARRQAEREREIERLNQIPVAPFDPESLR